MARTRSLTAGVTLCIACLACSHSRGSSESSSHGADTGFAAMQQRGKMAMGVDQTTSTHRFDALPDGGRIELQRDTDDSLGQAHNRIGRETGRARGESCEVDV